MATYDLGFMKINTDDGLAYSFGNGEVHHIPGVGKRARPAAQGAYSDGGYDGYDDTDAYDRWDYARYDDGDYPDGGYASRGYSDGYDDGDGYADDGYGGRYDSDDGYADDGYTDDNYGNYGRYDDGDYDDGYNGGYDDRYGDADADQYSSGGDYGHGGGSIFSGIMNYIDEHDWVTYVLLVLLPPLGIYLLWRRRMFDYTVRWAVSAVSGVWCVVALILLFSTIFSGSGDTTTAPPLNMGTVAPTVEASPSPEATDSLLEDVTSSGITLNNNSGTISPSDGITPAQTVDLLAPDVTATPLPGYDGGTNDILSAGTVLVTATGPYYHNNPNCSYLQTDEPTSRLTEEVALQRSKTPCPLCFPGQTIYYHTDIGKYYHSDKNCSDMKNPTPVTKEQAEKQGQTPCPVCITHEMTSLNTEGGLVYCDENTTDRSGLNVYCTKGGKNFHTKADCSGMTGAESVGLLQAMLAGKTACETCAATAGRLVWFNKGGTRYHIKSDCDGMTGAHQATLAEALIMGKTKCNICLGNVDVAFNGNGVAATVGNATAENGTDGAAIATGDVYVYATQGGQYYHTDATCSGMKNAQRVSLSSMLKEGRTACPVCAKGADTIVYATRYGTYYHSYANCGGMTDAVQGTMAEAMALGKKRCPNCWKAADDGAATAVGNNATGNQAAADENNANDAKNAKNAKANNIRASGTFVYATKTSAHYHTNANCSGMTNATRVDLAVAVYYGKTACPTCASAARRYVYSVDNGDYYHAKSSCGTMTNGKRRTLQSALLLGQKMCPTCKANAQKAAAVKNSDVTQTVTNVQAHSLPSVNTNVGGGIVSPGNGLTVNGSQSFSDALGSVFQGGASGGINGSNVGNVQSHDLPASTLPSSGKYVAGQSGVKVYASAGDRYYHGYRQHAGNGALKITLETALNYGKTACPTCMKAATTKVYAVRGGRYYHSSKSCAGTGAVSGTLGSALGYGLDACPVCVTHSKVVTNSHTYKSGASGIKVWATLSGSYFHGSRNCAGAGAKRVTLETAMNYGKTPCPNCASSAKHTVYSSASDNYYHSSREHAGDGASAGYWAVALALGKKACPVCIGGSESYEEPDVTYPAPGDTTVYVDINSSRFYYHKAASCSDGGMSNGTAVTLEFALTWGYHACPYCNPPTSQE